MKIESKKFTNPFPGLRPFETSEYRLFFGREGQSDALITRLQRARFLAVVGTSGSGKSSLVRAGLLPALRGGMMAEVGSGWRICTMRPGSDPFGNLAHSLVEKDVLPEAGGGLAPDEAEAMIEATLRRGSLGLVDAAQHGRLAGHEKLLVVVDQFEELFRFRAARGATSTDDDASAFVKLLLEATQKGKFSLYVVLTMRSDFLGDCAQFQGLPEAINAGQYLIPRMTRDERRMAITGPVGVTRGKMVEPLINRLLNDVGDNPDQLPILQHALMRTWDYWATHRRNGEPIGLEQYKTIGTMASALSLHADEAWNELPDKRSRHVAEKLFKALTEKGADNREIRRPTQLSEISAAAEATEDEVVAVIEVFRREGRSFLMPPTGVELSSDTVIDISHESLIRNWDRLQEWVDEEAQSARTYRRLAEAAVLHREGKEGLLIDPALQIAFEWREQHRPNRAWANRYHPEFDMAIGFLDTSLEQRDTQLAELERQRQEKIERDRRELEQAQLYAEQQRRAAQRMRSFTFALVLISLLASAAAVGAAYAFSQARKSAAQADTARQKAEVLLGRVQAGEVALREESKRYLQQKDEAEAAKKTAVAAQGRAETEAARANVQARIAAQNLIVAQRAKNEAELNAEQFKAAVIRSDLTRSGLEAFQREDYDAALKSFNCLRVKLEVLQAGATHSPAALPEPCHPGRTNFAKDLGWTLSNIGAGHLKKMDFNKATKYYEDAVNVLEPLFARGADVPILETYQGLARSYHAVAKSDRSDEDKSQEAFKKSEVFFKRALVIEEKLVKEKKVVQKPSEVAAGNLNLARLYVDTGRFDEARDNFKLAIDRRRLRENSSDLNTDERAALVAASRELADFYQRRSQYKDAIQVLNEMLNVQEKVSVRELIDQGPRIANSYANLGQIHKAVAEAKRREAATNEAASREAAKDKLDSAKGSAAYAKAENEETRYKREASAALEEANAALPQADVASQMADLLQRKSFNLRQMNRSQTSAEASIITRQTADLDEIGDLYVKLGKFGVAEKIYLDALQRRTSSRTEEWKSYDKLVRFYCKNKKDPAEAEKYKNPLKSAIGEADYLMQLGDDDPCAEDKSQSEQHYLDSLAIYRRQKNWEGENKIFARLSNLYQKGKRMPERLQVQRERVATMTGYFKQLAMKADPLPKDPDNLVYQYLYAINVLAYHNEDDAEAEANYKRALNAFDYIASNIDARKVLDFYAKTLEDYEDLLKNKLKREDEAAKVKEKAELVHNKVSRLFPSTPQL
jgi:tetratricopeptide (TPR) repeat protein